MSIPLPSGESCPAAPPGVGGEQLGPPVDLVRLSAPINPGFCLFALLLSAYDTLRDGASRVLIHLSK